MPRQSRIQIANGTYHVIARGLEKRDIFREEADKISFLSRLEKCLEKTGCKCLAWALMNNHFHLLIRTGTRPLSELMRKLLTGHAIYFNRKYKRHGYLYQNRYKSILCQEDVYLLELVRYIHSNPVRAGIISTIEELDEYPWTGHTAIVGKKKYVWQSVDDVLIQFGNRKKEAVERYKDFIEDRMIEKRDDLNGGGLIRSVGGWEEARKLQQGKERINSDERMLGDSEFVTEALNEANIQIEKKEHLRKQGWTIEKLAKRICEEYEVDTDILMKKGRSNSTSIVKGVLCYYGYKELDIGTKDLSEYLGISRYAVIKNAEKGMTYCRENGIKLLS